MGPSFWQDLTGGTVGGVIGMTVVYPLDTVKCRQRMMSWYRGLMSPLVGFEAMFAVAFASYGTASRFLLRRRLGEDSGVAGELTLLEMGSAGMFSGVATAPFRTIFERVKTVMQVRRGQQGQAPYSWSGACALDLVRKEGIAMDLFRGMGSTMLREGLQQAGYFPTYAITKAYLIPPGRPEADLSLPEPMLQMLAGGIAGCVTWLPPMYCVDVVKTRMQTAEAGVYHGAWDCFTNTVRAEGVPALLRGIGPSMLRAFPLHGLIFVGYETTLTFLDAR